MSEVERQVVVARIQSRIHELALSDPEAVFSEARPGNDHDRRARDIVESAVRAIPPQEADRIRSEYFGIGPLESLLTRPDVTEIIINGPDSIWYEANGRLNAWDDRFLSEITYRNFIQRVCREADMLVSLDRPFADGQWRNFRAHLISPPAVAYNALTLRRHPSNPWRLTDLEARAWASPEAMTCLRQLVARKLNFLIVGGTGSGKTSVLDACLQELPPGERVVVIEDTNELSPPNKSSTKLLTRRDAGGLLREIDQAELLRQSLRMRPDRIVMGEIRGAEAKDLLMAFATGHSGCMGTLHSDSARQALLRLEMLIQMGAAQWSPQAVRSLIHLSLHAVVVVTRTSDGGRKLEGIYRLASLEEVGFLLEKIA